MSVSLGLAAQRGVTIAEIRASLPVYKYRMHVLYLVETHQVTVVVGDARTGTTTQLPQYLYESGWTDHSKAIVCTHVPQLDIPL
jgi:ATP-dependent RNA helicase DDX35